MLFGEQVLDLWREVSPHARVSPIADAGHFVTEDAPDEVLAVLMAAS